MRIVICKFQFVLRIMSLQFVLPDHFLQVVVFDIFFTKFADRRYQLQRQKCDNCGPLQMSFQMILMLQIAFHEHFSCKLYQHIFMWPILQIVVPESRSCFPYS